MFAKDQFIDQKALQKRNLHVCSKRTRFSVSWKSLGDTLSRQAKYLFHRLSWKRLSHYGLEFKRLVYKVSGTLTCLGPKLCRAYLVFFGCRLARGLDLNSVIDYFTWDGKVNNEFIYDCINEKL